MNYADKEKSLANLLTIYGRKSVEEALKDKKLNIYKLHLADSNKKASILDNCTNMAKNRDIAIAYHDKRKLSFISKNAKQDQGIALDIQLQNLSRIEAIEPHKHKHLLMLDNVTNPQNVGMIIRSAGAGFIDGIIIPEKGCAELGPLVIKASAGSIFKTPIFRAKSTAQALKQLSTHYQLLGLSLNSDVNFFDYAFTRNSVMILGNESQGISHETQQACHQLLHIPMNNEIESLNVAITAALAAFHPNLCK